MNKDMLAFMKGVLILVVLLLLSIPLILMNVFEGELSGPWIGFWGSFSGGILGTIGVIFVAHLQNRKQQEENEKMMVEQRKLNNEQINEQNKNQRKLLESQENIIKETERYNRERIVFQYEMETFQSYSKEIKNFSEIISNIETEVSDYLLYRELLIQINLTFPQMDESILSEHPSYNKAIEMIDKSFEYIKDFSNYQLLNLYNSLLIKNKYINKRGYSTQTLYSANHITLISGAIYKIRLDTKDHNQPLDLDRKSINDSFKVIDAWSINESLNSAKNLDIIAEKLSSF